MFKTRPSLLLHNHCSDTIEGYFSRLEWARSAGFINRTLFAFGWMVPEDATGPFNPPLNATHGLHMPKRCDKIGCDNPNGWTLPKLRASMLRLKAAFPEMPGVLGWGGNRGGCGNASRAFLRGASKLMAELWPSGATLQPGGALKSDEDATTSAKRLASPDPPPSCTWVASKLGPKWEGYTYTYPNNSSCLPTWKPTWHMCVSLASLSCIFPQWECC